LTLELEVAVDFDVGHRDGQHLLVDVYSCDPVRHRPLLAGAESVPRRINQGRELSPREHGDAQLFGQSRTLRIKQLLGLACSMANLDLAAPNTAILHTRRFSCLFAGLRAQLQPVAKVVQTGEPHPKRLFLNNLSHRPRFPSTECRIR
jgi:hypothetical protein